MSIINLRSIQQDIHSKDFEWSFSYRPFSNCRKVAQKALHLLLGMSLTLMIIHKIKDGFLPIVTSKGSYLAILSCFGLMINSVQKKLTNKKAKEVLLTPHQKLSLTDEVTLEALEKLPSCRLQKLGIFWADDITSDLIFNRHDGYFNTFDCTKYPNESIVILFCHAEGKCQKGYWRDQNYLHGLRYTQPLVDEYLNRGNHLIFVTEEEQNYFFRYREFPPRIMNFLI